MKNTRLKIEIIRSGLKQFTVGEKLGMRETKITKIVTGRQPIDRKNAVKLAILLRSRIEYLFDENLFARYSGGDDARQP